VQSYGVYNASSSTTTTTTNFITTLLSSKKTAEPLSRNWCYVKKIKIDDQWRSSPYDRRNNSVFSAFLNWFNNGTYVINGSRLFQTFAAATGKARSPIVLWIDRGTWCSAVYAERCRLRELMSATRCNPSARYCGAVPLMHIILALLNARI